MPLIKKGTILRNAEITRQEQSRGKDTFIYSSKTIPHYTGIVFPNDNIISIGEIYDVIVNQVVEKNSGGLLLSEVYYDHDSKKLLGKIIKIKVSDFGHKGDPMFLLHGYRGFVKKGAPKLGDKIIARITSYQHCNKIEDILNVEMLGLLE